MPRNGDATRVFEPVPSDDTTGCSRPGPVAAAGPLPPLSFTGTTYTATVSNVGAGPSNDTIVVQLFKDFGLDIVSASGTGWTCDLTRCSTSDFVPSGGGLPPITFTVDPRSTYA